jgi:c-di-GMP-binding flagellar brake protein YcgR
MAPKDDAAPPPTQEAERRKESRHTVDGTATLYLPDPGIRLRGRILDLSLNGCQFRTEDCFPLGIRSRVEIEFHLDGLPFRLAGVTQSIHKRHKVGVRFLNVSERKREQLVELIAEIEEIKARVAVPNPNVPGR